MAAGQLDGGGGRGVTEMLPRLVPCWGEGRSPRPMSMAPGGPDLGGAHEPDLGKMNLRCPCDLRGEMAVKGRLQRSGPFSLGCRQLVRVRVRGDKRQEPLDQAVGTQCWAGQEGKTDQQGDKQQPES